MSWKNSKTGVTEKALFLSNVVPDPPSVITELHTITNINASDIVYDMMVEGKSYDEDACFKPHQGVLWMGDYHVGKRLLSELSSQVKRLFSPDISSYNEKNMKAYFLAQRQAMIASNRFLSHILVQFDSNYELDLPRAPPLRNACEAAFGSYESLVHDDAVIENEFSNNAKVAPRLIIPLREVLGAIGAYEWRKKGVMISALGSRIYPHFSVFAPTTRQEYVDLFDQAMMKHKGRVDLAYEIGVGTGVLTAVMLRRGVRRVIATDVNPRSLECARDNLEKLNLLDKVQLLEADGYPSLTDTPTHSADLIVCNPPWLPLQPHSLLDRGVYDDESYMLSTLLCNARHHLKPYSGECFLLLSNLAELIQLRSREDLLNMFQSSGLVILDKVDTPAVHKRGTF